MDMPALDAVVAKHKTTPELAEDTASLGTGMVVFDADAGGVPTAAARRGRTCDRSDGRRLCRWLPGSPGAAASLGAALLGLDACAKGVSVVAETPCAVRRGIDAAASLGVEGGGVVWLWPL